MDNPMRKFLHQWGSQHINPVDIGNSRDARYFYADLFNAITMALHPYGIKIARFNPNRRFCGMHMEKDGQYLYTVYPMPKSGHPVDFLLSDIQNGVTYRPVDNLTACNGNPVESCSLWDLPKTVVRFYANAKASARTRKGTN
jgi:hypothetical protein